MRFVRNRERWTRGEERRLMKIYAGSEGPSRVFWCDKWRRAPCYRAARVLGRSPSAVSGRWNELSRCRARRSENP